MSFSLQLLGVTVLLLPGFAEVIRIRVLMNDNRIVRALPDNGAIIYITFVPIFALFYHILWATFFLLIGASLPLLGVSLPFNLNPYLWIFNAGGMAPSGLEIAYLAFVAWVAAMTPLFIHSLFEDFIWPLFPNLSARNPHKEPGADESWLDYLMRASRDETKKLLCYVAVSEPLAAGYDGYVGDVETVKLAVTGEVQHITLKDCRLFRLELGDNGFAFTIIGSTHPISLLMISRDQIRSTHFEVSSTIGVDAVSDAATPALPA